MVENISIRNHKGLKEVDFNNLGRINVLCGKNNSGKTTILEAFNDIGKRCIGHIFTKEDYQYIYDKSIKKLAPDFLQSKCHLLAWYKDLLIDMSKGKRIWYSDFVHEFVDVVHKNVNQTDLKSDWRHFEPNIKSAFYEIFKRIPQNSILVPPKRGIENEIEMKTDSIIESNGNGVLNKLFLLKNNEDSKENRIYEQIKKAFQEISSNYDFKIVFSKATNNIKLKIKVESDNWYDAINCGLGLQELLVVLYFSIHPSYNIVLLEEPENHLHPEMQKKLLSYITTLNQKQFIISTHSNIFLNYSYIDKVYFVYFDKEVKINDATKRAVILNDIGCSISDNITSDLVIFVEGPYDRPVIEELLKEIDLYDKYDIKIWPMGGDIMDQLELNIFAENYKIIAIIDNDPKSKEVRERFIKKCEQENILYHRLERYSIENYFTLEALKRVFGSDIKPEIEMINPDKKLEEQLGFSVKKNNRKIIREMKLADIEKTDLFMFLTKVKEMCEE